MVRGERQSLQRLPTPQGWPGMWVDTPGRREAMLPIEERF
jgi:hypothetical protein